MAGDMFKLRRPCAHCPFRTDIPGYLRPERAVEISRSLAEGAIFPCHETTVTDPDDESDRVPGAESQFCAGALLVMENMGAPNQAMRTAERFGLYDPTKMDKGAPVASSFIEFVNHHGGADEEEAECCEVVNGGCEAPAGYMVGGMVVPAEATGEVHECSGCGRWVCSACSDDDGVCDYCAGDENQE